MGLLEKIFPKQIAEAQVYTYFQTLSGYSPVYTSFDGGVYEMALTRACIHTFANHVSKLKPVVLGPGTGRLSRVLEYRPNQWMDTKKYLYRLATIYKAENNAFIAPIYDDELHRRIVGYFPVLASQAVVVELGGKQYIRYSFPAGVGVTPIQETGMLTQMQYRDDFFGEQNQVLRPVMEAMNAQNQSIVNGVRASGTVRFLAKLAQVLKPDALNMERDRLVRDNLGSDNGGVMIFDAKYADIKPIESKPYVVDDKQAASIRESVFDYFGMSAAILQSAYTADEWSAYYESQIEPFAIELSMVHTNMTYTPDEIARGKQIIFSVNRLQHMTMADKLSTVTQLFDRGMMNMDEGREVFQLPELGTEDSRRYYIRRDYAEVNALNQQNGVKEDGENAGEDAAGISGDAPADPDAGQQEV